MRRKASPKPVSSMTTLPTRNSAKDIHAFFFLVEKYVSKVHVTCHNHGHTSLSSARTFVEQNWPWLLSLELRNIVTSFFTSMSSDRGGHLHEQHFNNMSAWWRWLHREKSIPNISKGVWLIRKPRSWYDLGFLFFLFAIFSAERRYYTYRANSWMKHKWVRNRTQRRSATRRKMSHRKCIIF